MGLLFEALDQACLGGSQGGQNAEDETCGEREKKGKQKNGAVKFGVGKIAGILWRAEGPEETAALVADSESGNAAKQAEEHALGQKLADEPSAAGADGETNGDFLPPAHRTRHQQVGNVRAGNEQHQAHDEQQHRAYQRQAALAAGAREQCRGHGLHRSRVPCIRIRIYAPQGSGQRFETGIRLAAADSGLEARDPLKEGLSALLQHILELRRQDLLRHGRRKPYIRPEDGADSEESLRRHSNHCEWSAVDFQGFSDHVLRAVEAVFPGAVAHHGNGSGSRRADFAGQKESAFCRCEAERFKVTLGDQLAEKALLRYTFDQRHRHGRREAAKTAERGVPSLVVLEIRIRDRKEAGGLLLILQVRRIERDETGGILCWKRMKQQSVHDRKYRGACADAQGQRQNGKKGKGRRSRYSAQSIIQVAEEVGEQIVPARCCRPWNALVVSALGPADLLFPVRHSSPSMTRLMVFTNLCSLRQSEPDRLPEFLA